MFHKQVFFYFNYKFKKYTWVVFYFGNTMNTATQKVFSINYHKNEKEWNSVFLRSKSLNAIIIFLKAIIYFLVVMKSLSISPKIAN